MSTESYVAGPSVEELRSGWVDVLLAERAGFSVRLTAYMIDQLIIGSLTLVLGLGAFIALGLPELTLDAGAILDLTLERVFSLSGLILGLGFWLDGLYFVFFHGYSGQTIGKLIMGLRVVSRDGAPLSYWRAFMRWLGYFASSLPLGFGYLLILFTRDRVALHDIIAATCVVHN